MCNEEENKCLTRLVISKKNFFFFNFFIPALVDENTRSSEDSENELY